MRIEPPALAQMTEPAVADQHVADLVAQDHIENRGRRLIARLLHYFSELRKDTIPRGERTLLRFLAYFSYAPGLMQGPIERFERFNSEIDTCHERRTPKTGSESRYASPSRKTCVMSRS